MTPQSRRHAAAHPEAAALIVEISDSSSFRDQSAGHPAIPVWVKTSRPRNCGPR